MSFFKRKSEHHSQKEEFSHPGDRSHTSPPFNGHAKDPAQARPRQSVIPASAPRPSQERNEHRNTMQPQAVAERAGRGTPPTGHRPGQQATVSKQQQQNAPSYPWSTRQLTLSPGESSGPQNALISPFPRYGLSLPPVPTQSGHLLIFGGLVREAVRNDLFALDCHDFSAAPIQSFGEIPVPRVGHASALVRSVLLLWGGDTKTRMEDEQDEAIYLFNIHTREWTRILANGDRPQGRYGHAVCMIGNTFYLFGGQADGLFMNDLWGFDLSTLMAGPTWHLVESVGIRPPARTGHVMVTGQNKLYIFGGTDGAFHYNDTWCYDLQTRTWAELQCIGYIPVPREGHAAALVDDTMYIFGGRDVNGKDLGDLAAFKISNRRWYMFQNMGPAPSGRSGHAMAAFGKHVFVLGGESNAAFAQPRGDDPNVVHVLDTSKIKYPPETQRSAQPETSGESESKHLDRKTSTPGSADAHPAAAVQQSNQSTTQVAEGDQAFLAGRKAESRPIRDPDVRSEQEQRSDNANTFELAPVLLPQATPQAPTPPDAGRSTAPPQRPRREGDEVFNQRTAVSRTSPIATSVDQPGIPANNGTLPPPGRTSPPYRTVSPPPIDVANARQANSIMSAKTPPADAFYYGTRSPTSAGFPSLDNGDMVEANNARGLAANHSTLLAESERRNAVLRAALEQAIANGAAVTPTASALLSESSEMHVDTPEQILQAALAVQERLSAMKLEFSERIEELAEEYAAAERLRDGALQEASYFRAKLAILESDNPTGVEGIEAERIMDLEDTLVGLEEEKRGLVERMSELSLTVESLTVQMSTVQSEVEEASSRADRAEQIESTLRSELKDAQTTSFQAESAVRELKSRDLEKTALLATKDAEIADHRQRGKEATSERESHLRLLDVTKNALALANRKVEAATAQHQEAVDSLHASQADLRSMRAAHDERSSEAKANATRVEALQESVRQLEEENRTLRSLAESNVSRAGDLSRSKQPEGESNDTEHLAAMMQDSASLRKMLNEAGAQIDSAQTNLMVQRKETDALRSDGQKLREEIAYLKQMRKERAETADRARGAQARKNNEDRRLQEEHMALTARCAMLRGLLTEHGIAIEEGEGNATSSAAADARQMRAQLEEQSRRLEDTQEELSRARAQLLELKLHPEASSSGPFANGAAGSRSASATVEEDSPDLKRQHLDLQARHKQLTVDYETACRYVKQSERIFRRMKDDLTRQKNVNDSLRAELAALEGAGSDAGSRTRTAVSGRVTPGADAEIAARQQQRLSKENGELREKMEALQEELGAARDISQARDRQVQLANKRADEAQKSLDSVNSALDDAGGLSVPELVAANLNLRDQVSQLQLRVNLLLDNDEDSGSNIRHSSDLDFGLGFGRHLSPRSDSDDDEVTRSNTRNHAS